MIICKINFAKKEAIITSNNEDKLLNFNNINYVSELNNDDKLINNLKLIKRLSIDLKTEYSAKNIDTAIIIDDLDLYNLICPNGTLIDKLTKTDKKTILNNNIKLNLGCAITELNSIKNLQILLKGEEDKMFTNKDNYQIGSALHSLKPQENKLETSILKNSNANKNIYNSNITNEPNDDFEISFDDENDYNEKEIHNVRTELSNTNENLNTSSTNHKEDDDFEIEFNEDIVENKDILDINDTIKENEDTDNFEIDFDNEEDNNNVNTKKENDFSVELNSDTKEDINSNITNNNNALESENFEIELDSSTEFTSSNLEIIYNNENNLDLLENDTNKSDNNMNLSLDIINDKSTPIYNNDSKDTLVHKNNGLSDEFEFLYSYIEQRTSELNTQINSLKEQSKEINLNIGDLNIDEDTILQKFNATMEIRSKLKVIENSCKIYSSIKELLDGNLK